MVGAANICRFSIPRVVVLRCWCYRYKCNKQDALDFPKSMLIQKTLPEPSFPLTPNKNCNQLIGCVREYFTPKVYKNLRFQAKIYTKDEIYSY